MLFTRVNTGASRNQNVVEACGTVLSLTVLGLAQDSFPDALRVRKQRTSFPLFIQSRSPSYRQEKEYSHNPVNTYISANELLSKNKYHKRA